MFRPKQQAQLHPILNFAHTLTADRVRLAANRNPLELIDSGKLIDVINSTPSTVAYIGTIANISHKTLKPLTSITEEELDAFVGMAQILVAAINPPKLSLYVKTSPLAWIRIACIETVKGVN